MSAVAASSKTPRKRLRTDKAPAGCPSVRKKPATATAVKVREETASEPPLGCIAKKPALGATTDNIAAVTTSSQEDGSNNTLASSLVRVEAEDFAHCCPAPPRTLSSGQPRVALSTCSRGCPAPRLREWLFWHLAEGLQPIFLRWEGLLNADHRAALQGPLERGEVIMKQITKHTGSGSFQSVMCRQVRFVHGIITVARARGCDFLLHLDDDELLCPKEPDLSVAGLFRRHMNSSARCIHFDNIEAVFPFTTSTAQPFTRSETRFRTGGHVLYCNGKSAANLRVPEVFCSGVHHFCKYDRSFEAPQPEFGLHDEGGGCTDPGCCIVDDRALVLHCDSPSFEEWDAKFSVRAASHLTNADDEELQTFPFKKESVEVMRRPTTTQEREDVYRRYRCLPSGAPSEFNTSITGQTVVTRLQRQLQDARERAAAIRKSSSLQA